MKSKLGLKAETGAADPGGERATMRDIAWLAGVPKKTISRAIEGAPEARAEARAEILAFLRRDAGPASPRRPGGAQVGRLVGFVYDAQNPERVVGWQDGLMDALTEAGFELAIRRVDADSLHLFEDIRGFIVGQKLAGVALASPLSNDERLVAMIRALGVGYAAIAPSPARAARREGRIAGERLAAARNG